VAHALLRNPGSGERGRPHHRLNSGWLRRTFGIDAQYNLVEIATNKSVLTGSTFSRVSYDMPGSYQRFARSRAYRDAEDRASDEIAENINLRLAAFFTAGT